MNTITTRTITDVVWDAMKSAYGARWAKSFGTHDESGIWTKALAKYHPQQVTQAVAEAIKHYLNYPPTLGQFMALCRAIPTPDAPLQLERQHRETTAEEQRQWIGDLKAMMAKAESKASITDEQREYHLKVLGLDDASMAKKQARYVNPGSPAACAYPGCSSPGVLSSTLAGANSWYCANHFHGIRKQ